MRKKISLHIKKQILKHIENYDLSKEFKALYDKLSLKYKIDSKTIKQIHITHRSDIKKQKYHLKMDEIIAEKIKSNPHNLFRCFRELSEEYKEPFKYFQNRYYRHVKNKYKLFYIEYGDLKLFNTKQIN